MPTLCETGNIGKKKLCCVCKETKAARDECVVSLGEDQCRAFIDAHNKCLKSEGFEVVASVSRAQ